MVSHFMGYHVGIGKIAVGTYGMFHILEKIKVDIYGLVCRTVEWACLGGCLSAAGVHGAAEKHHPRGFIFAPALPAEFPGPDVFGSGQHLRGEYGQLFVFGCGFVGAL